MAAALRPQFDADLIARYGGSGPRYTSYPTADRMAPDFPVEQWHAAVAESNRLLIPPDLSLYVHVPFCASPCFYCGCNRIITRSPVAGAQFLAELNRELALVAPRFDADRQVRQIHLGGGTPTFLRIPELARLMDALRGAFPVADDAEIGLEVDPRTVDATDIRELKAMGFNRISIGIQDLDPEVQQAVNRVHDTATVAAVVGAARGAGFESISVDLIYGLPLQTTEAFARTVDAVVAMRPDRVSLFNYAHLPETFKAQRQIREADLPAPAIKLALFRNSLNRLLEAGYQFIGMDHFALPDDALAKARADSTMVRNFQGYSTGGELDLIGLGPSAISQVGDAMVQNERRLEGWKIVLAQGRLPVARGLVRNREDRLRADIIAAVMCRGEVRYRDLEADHDCDFRRQLAGELETLHAMAADGLLEMDSGGFRVTATGMLFLRAIARVFDAWIANGGRSGQRFSRIV